MLLATTQVEDFDRFMVPIADGSDTGGSLRNPPAFCNVVGLRPSPGRVPAESGSWSPLSVSGPIARSVADVALFLSAIAGPDPRSSLSINDDPGRFRAPLARDMKSPELPGAHSQRRSRVSVDAAPASLRACVNRSSKASGGFDSGPGWV